MTCIPIIDGIATVGGNILSMKLPCFTITFEMHSYLGPMRLRASDHEPSKTDFPMAFWLPFECWLKDGKPVDKFNRVILRDPEDMLP